MYRTKSLFFSIAAALFLAGCSGWSIPFLSSPPPNRAVDRQEILTRIPRFVMVDGKPCAVVDEIRLESGYRFNQQEPKIPAWKRLLNAMLGWSLIGTIILGILTFLGIPAIPALLMAIRRIRASNKQLQQIVAGVDRGLEALPDTQRETFKAELSKTYDEDTKKAVVKVKEGV